MGLKKGFCVKCHGEEVERIFDVNAEASVCYCPNCMSEYSPKEAISNYNKLIQKHLGYAQKVFFDMTKYQEAYGSFAQVLELDPTNGMAMMGRILALIRISTLRKSKLEDALKLFKFEATKFHDNKPLYAQFLKICDTYLEEYKSAMKKRLSYKKYFFNKECLDLYLLRLLEIIEFKKFILSESGFLDKYDPSPNFEAFEDRVNKKIKQYLAELESSFNTCEGFSYRFVQVGENGKVVCGRSDEKEKVRLSSKLRKYSLLPDAKRRYRIKDKIYPNHIKRYKLRKSALLIAIALFVVFLAFASISVFTFIHHNEYFLFTLAAPILFLGGAITFLCLHFNLEKKAKKRVILR